MSKQAKRRQHRQSASRPNHTGSPASFTPVPVRRRHDGWTAARQAAFLQTLAECACVTQAAEAVGMSTRSAYTLKARSDACSFRQAWDAVLDFAVGRLSDGLISRALHGEVTPVFFRGEQVGERRRYDNRLAMWILRLRQPERYGKWRDALVATRGHEDGAAAQMRTAVAHAIDDARADDAGRPRARRAPLRSSAFADDPEVVEADRVEQAHREEAAEAQRLARYRDTLAHQAMHALDAMYGDDAA